MRKKTYLYIDDIRIPDPQLPWNVVRNFEEATSWIQRNGLPDVISFDHDLGEEKTGYDIAKWIIEMVLDGFLNIPDGFVYYIHSSNPVGRDNIDGLFISFFGRNNDI